MDEQHDFYPGCSTTFCKLLFTNFVFNAFQQRSQVDVLYMDFKKTFDSINQDIQLIVLKATDFGEPLFI